MPWLFLTKRSEQKTTSKSAKKSESPETGFVATENKKNKKKTLPAQGGNISQIPVRSSSIFSHEG